MPEYLEAPGGVLGRLCGWERGLTLLCLAPGRSKILWLHSFLSFFYFITNLFFMAHHCLWFVPRKSSKVSEKAARTAPSQLEPLPSWTFPLPASEASQLGTFCTPVNPHLAPLHSQPSVRPLNHFQTGW